MRIIAIVLAFVLASSVGCGKKEDKAAQEPEIVREAPEPEPVEAEVSPEPKGGELEPERLGPRYVIQLAAWEREEDAAWMARWLRSLGYDAWVESAYIPSKGREYHRVRMGSFTDYRRAKEEAIRISREIGSGYWVVKED